MKNKKLALAKSLLALLLCVAMLVSTTFAWFTDSVVSGINTIAAGNLDVELYHSNAAVTNQKVTANTRLFLDLQGNPILWEPGVVTYENLRVTNEGDLALIYQLAINTANENYILDNGARLSQALKVGVVEGGITATDRDGVVASVKSWTTLSAFLCDGSLLAGAEETWGVVIYWQPGDNDNYWNANNGRQLSSGDALSIDLGIKLTATQEQYENDSFGNDYDVSAKDDAFPSFGGGTAGSPIEVGADNRTTAAVTIAIGNITATIPAGVLVEEGTNELTLTIKTLSTTSANVVLGEDEAIRSLDVHVEGVSANNDTPITVTLPEVAPVALNMGNYNVYHVENGATNEMTLVASNAAFDAHNQYKYDPATGDVVLYMATFSEVALTAEDAKWKGGVDHSWYDASATQLTIANADQLWSFSQIVGGMAEGIERDNFSGKTVKLIADIDLNDAEDNNQPHIFYPIGYWNNELTYERKPVAERTEAVNSALYNFCGTFDGNGHTIANFYHNTWEMKGDHNWYSAVTEQYYRDGMGLFGRVYGATIKNLTVDNFKSDGEIATTGVIAAYAEGTTFENIAVTNCNPRVYNIGNGGIVGCVGWYAKEEGLKTTFKNITVDNSNKISALWGSYDVACGGIVGQYYPTSGQSSANYPVNGGISFENCHIAAQMDVYNDVCGNYQYYAYRYAGMLIGSVRENETIDGHSYPKMDGITAKDCTVHFGTWNDYYYCEFEKNGHPSYSGPDDYKFSRIPHSEINFTDSNDNGIIDTDEERASVTGCKHEHTAAENNQAIRLPFNNIVTGYGWGVTSKGLTDFDGVDNMDIIAGDHENSVTKFEGKVNSLTDNREYTLGEIFKFVDNGVKLVPGALTVTITNLDEDGNVTADFVRNPQNWENGTIQFTGSGNIAITIQDYYFCTATTINVNIVGRQPEKKFDIVMNNGDFLHRVGNVGTVALNKLFAAKSGATIGNVAVTIYSVGNSNASGSYTSNPTWNNGTIQFYDTGVVCVEIADDDYCDFTVLYLEVVDATNVTGLSGTLTGNVVLLNDCGLSSLTVSSRNTVYGNGFTATYTGVGQYLNNGLKMGVINVSENGMLDNLRVKASIYPAAYLFYSEAQNGPKDTEGTKTRYHYQLSAVTASGNATIQNCYIYGGRTNVYIGDGNVTIKDTVLECGTLANSQIVSSNEHTVTFDNVTTIQHQVNATVGDTSKVMMGAAILVGDGDKDNTNATAPAISLKGTFKQYNWVTAADKNAVSDDNAEMIIGGALGATAYNHTINGINTSNMGIIYLNNGMTANVNNETGLPYVAGSVSLSLSGVSVSRPVYSIKNATEAQIYSDTANADRTTVNDLYQPQFKFDSTLGGQYVAKTDDGDEFCYVENDIVKVMFPNGDTKTLDLSALVNITKYSGQNLNLNVTCKDSNGNAVTVSDGKVDLFTAGTYTITYAVTDTLFYDKDGKQISKTLNYSWNVTVDVALKDTAVPNAEFVFDSSVQKIFRSGNSNIVQFIPFLSGLKIYDYNAQGERYLRFDGGNTTATTDYNKIAKASIENVNTTAEGQGYHIVTIEFTDGGKLVIDMDVRANSGSSTHSGSIKVRNNVIYVVNGGTTSGKGQTWKIYSYKFVGNNGTEINSGLITFGTTGTDCDTATKPSSNFGTTVKYTVTYDANGGNCGQSISYATSVSTAVTLPTPSRSGYIFAGWYTAASGGTRVGGAGESYTPSANITLYAQWGKPCTVTYNANGGSCGTASEKYTGTALTLPTPTRDGYWFIGWYDAATGGNKIGGAGATYNPADEITLYAHWQEAIKYTVTYNANGGSCGTTSATYQGTALTLPTPSRTGYTFNGWYTAASGGTKIGDAGVSYIPSADITLYAQWKINSYKVTVTTSNASVSGVSNNQEITYGTTVSVTVSFDKSNSKTFTVKNDTTGETILSKSDAGTYTFTMPDSSVTINASSSGCFVAGTLITLADGSMKPVEEITYDDMLLAWDFNTGSYAVTVPSLIEFHETEECRVIALNFADGTVVRIVAEHGFFDVESNKFVFIDENNVADYIGHDFVKVSANGSYETVELIGYNVTVETVSYYTIQTAVYNNCIAENMFTLTSPPEMLDNDEWFNYFEIGEGMKYDEAKMQADIEKYGLYEYSDFAEYVTYEQFLAFNGPYLKVLVGKGYITLDEIIALIGIFVNP